MEQKTVMTIMNHGTSRVGIPGAFQLPALPPLHRIGDTRRLQGFTRRTVARRLKVDIAQIRREEQATTDLRLSRLYEWQRVLEVPVAELLCEADNSLSEPILKRAQLVRVMKTALAIVEECKQPSVRRMAETMVEQLIEVMPELEGVSAWHAVGKRRRRDDYGIAAQRRLSDDVFRDLQD